MKTEPYTTLVMVKMMLNDGSLPPMTPIPEKIRHIINPEYVPGFGALNEDEEKGLQCPVCGAWKHWLSSHVGNAHQEIGGARGLRKLMGMPLGMSLLSRSARERTREAHKGRDTKPMRRGLRNAKRRNGKRRKLTVAERNFRNTCHAQLGHFLWDLRNKLGRSPSFREGCALEPTRARAAIHMYGTWNAAKAAHGLDVVGRYTASSPEAVTAAIAAWVEVRGRLPGAADAQRGLPWIPPYSTVLRQLKCDSWKGAMRKVAIRLGAYDARYRPEPT